MAKLAALFLVFVLPPRLPPADVSGVWNLEMRWSGSATSSTGVCTLKQVDLTVTGSCEGAPSRITGEVKDRSVALRIAVEQDGHKGVMTFAGTLGDDPEAIEGTCEIEGGQSGTFVMKKRPQGR